MAQGFLGGNSVTPPPGIGLIKSTEEAGGVRVHNLTLTDIVKDPELCQVFERFCTHELAGENFRFWLEAQMYGDIDNGSERKMAFARIYNTYLSEHADTEINMSGPERISVEEARRAKFPPTDVFVEIQMSVWTNLRTELLPRFQRSDMLDRYLKGELEPVEVELSREKLEDFFGMPIKGPLQREELVMVATKRGFLRRKKRMRPRRVSHHSTIRRTPSEAHKLRQLNSTPF
mmetsp:Transcript_30924/g.86636  ORF Transcript_30924/g.86636 Transcript_30924/m.86636 type:complete len:232 (-) Transcript_30924:301-996(-)|eukprot:CAMPEP_0119124836 /NCGR_PEP_ID=MMETSP1310-20130426/4329_1 /TAXON_ID=464262 /ORGANISM="Genus nov. species nov., Strain RCC2339" /LENGTH=231 /DNA_ID=CAMNT_0007114843 /DNA_START=58 /DNA_END=753 /DNA_ORIENTATION=-